ncbi:MAG TPA: RagB/SusD family nutrient uptake outer membrane protein [Saprospirales bacterium]|nr:RagB/SusD family nutrient uptake outer membrane protein [Saprospirales bacterium]
MKNIFNKLLILFLVVGMASCSLDEVANPNGPTQESYATDATSAQLQLLATGVEADMRNDMEFYYQTVSIVGREYYDLNGTDPRYTGELLGAGDGDGVLDNNGFLTTRSFGARYKSVRNAQNLINAVSNSAAGLDDAGKNGFYSFANTVKAYQLLLTLNRQFNNGVRLDIENPDNLGPFVSYSEGLTGIVAILETAKNQAAAAGSDFQFGLSSGFTGYDTPSTFTQFINALMARVQLYAGNNSGAISALEGSFIDAAGDMNAGPAHIFSGSGNDQLNPIFYPETQKYMAHPTFVTDAESGDNRLSKVTTVDEAMIDGLSGDQLVSVYASNDAPVSIIRNEELVLIAAEANIGNDNGMAASMINAVRTANALDSYTGGMDDASLTNEVLTQRRYSLFGEGHRWIDMRRAGRLGDLPIDRAGDEVFTQFPRPVLEPQ